MKNRLAQLKTVHLGVPGATGQIALPNAKVVHVPENETAPTPHATSATSWPWPTASWVALTFFATVWTL